jgi:hypothetical protein
MMTCRFHIGGRCSGHEEGVVASELNRFEISEVNEKSTYSRQGCNDLLFGAHGSCGACWKTSRTWKLRLTFVTTSDHLDCKVACRGMFVSGSESCQEEGGSHDCWFQIMVTNMALKGPCSDL